MQDDKKEWLSALVDSQADLKDLDQVVDSVDNKDTWLRYHLIGDVMRNEANISIDVDLIGNIESAIANEPGIASLAARRTLKQRIAQSEWLAGLMRRGSTFMRQSAQFAVAASVALVTVLSVQHYQQSDDGAAVLPVLQTTGPIIGNIVPVSLSTGAGPVVDKRQVQLDTLRQQQRIKAMLFDHQQQLRLNAHQSRARTDKAPLKPSPGQK